MLHLNLIAKELTHSTYVEKASN